jgi:hypothetical protein
MRIASERAERDRLTGLQIVERALGSQYLAVGVHQP